MEDVDVIPELKQIIGALLFAARAPISSAEMCRVLHQAAEGRTGPAKDFAEVTEADVVAAIEQLRRDLAANHIGVHVAEVANGYRLQNDANCGLWVRQMLNKGRDSRLSKPALETLAIIAYRQPIMRSEIEAVRGVQVDQVMRTLLDMQLIRIVGRSELPGRPWLFGTTQKFLEYFGLRNVQDLPGIEELKRMEEERKQMSGPAPEREASEPAAPTESGAPVQDAAESGAEDEDENEDEGGDGDEGEEEVVEEDDDEYDDDEFDDDDEDVEDDEEDDGDEDDDEEEK